MVPSRHLQISSYPWLKATECYTTNTMAKTLKVVSMFQMSHADNVIHNVPNHLACFCVHGVNQEALIHFQRILVNSPFAWSFVIFTIQRTLSQEMLTVTSVWPKLVSKVVWWKYPGISYLFRQELTSRAKTLWDNILRMLDGANKPIHWFCISSQRFSA